MSLCTSESLLCIPTPLEQALLATVAPDVIQEDRWAAVALVGFGAVASAARTAELLASTGAKRVVLLGIAGTFGPDELVGTAVAFDQVAVDGIGADEGDDFQSPTDMGFPQWAGLGGDTPGRIDDTVPLKPLTGPGGGTLLTVCAAAATDAMVARRRTAHPDAVAEDMEGFATALAAHLAGADATIVRGISNVAGNRDAASWRIHEALAAAAALLRPHLT